MEIRKDLFQNIDAIIFKRQEITTVRSYLNYVIPLSQIEILNQKINDHHYNQDQFFDQLIYHFQIRCDSSRGKISKTYKDFLVFHDESKKIQNDLPKLPAQKKQSKWSFQISSDYFRYQLELEEYLNKIKKNPKLCQLLLNFINYPHIFTQCRIKQLEQNVLTIEDQSSAKLVLNRDYLIFQSKKYKYCDYSNQIKAEYSYQFKSHFLKKSTIYFQFKILLKQIVLRFKIKENLLLFIRILDHFQKIKLSNRYQSTYQIRQNCNAEFLIDGAQHFRQVYYAIKNAKQSIYITGWFISPEVFLVRPVINNLNLDDNPDTCLKGLLEKKSLEGVKIYVIIWKNAKILNNNSKHVFDTLTNLKGGNVKVITSPHQNLLFLLSHHQKIIVVDQNIGFVSGTDLAYGRYDDASHPIFQYTQKVKQGYQTFPGMDYYNGTKAGFKNVDDYNNRNYWRPKNLTRLPWHDTSVKLTGPIVYDLSREFINYFNVNICPLCYQSKKECNDGILGIINIIPGFLNQFIKKTKGQTVDYRPEDQKEKIPDISKIKNIPVLKPYKQSKTGTVDCQIVRSASYWTHKIEGKEYSIQNAYIQLIENSKNYIYIENQFLISSSAGSKIIYNRIIKTLISRIIKASRLKQKFRVYVIIPCVPQYADSNFSQISTPLIEKMFNYVKNSDPNVLQETMYWQNQTIQYGYDSIYNVLKKQGIDVKEYIQILSLRNHGINPFNHSPETQIIYMHSKMMIVDDEYVCIGSSNINDRGMNGDRDSQINVVINDNNKIQKLMNGKNTQVGKKIYELRKRIFEQHFGCDSLSIIDPTADLSWQQIRENAKNNTAIYEQIFHCFPTNKIRTFAQLIEYKKQKISYEKYWKVKNLKGHIVEYSSQFLCEDRQKMRAEFIQYLTGDLII